MLQDGVRKKRMELIEKERKQREQVSILLYTSRKGYDSFYTFSCLLIFVSQMFLLKAEQMKRYEKEKVGGKSVHSEYILLFFSFYMSSHYCSK